MQQPKATKVSFFDTRDPRLGVVELTQRIDGRSIRTAFGRRLRPNGRYYSRKTGQSHWWESRTELLDLHHAEVSPGVLAYTTQPETLRWCTSGGARQYTPDRLDELADGSFRVVEVKDVFNASDDPDYAAKLNEAEEIYSLMGVHFVLRTRAEITAEPLYSAVEEVQAHRRTLVTTPQVVAAGDLLDAGPISFDEFVCWLPSPHSRASALAMMVDRYVSIDLRRGLTGSSSVSLVGRTG